MTEVMFLPKSKMQAAQDSIAAQIRRLPLIRTHEVPVQSEDEGDLLSQIAGGLGKGLGLFIFVTIVMGKDPAGNVPGPVLKNVGVVVGVWSSPTLHEGKPRIKPMIEYLMSNLHLFKPDQAAAPLEMDDPAFKRLPWKGAVYYELYFKTRFQFQNQTQGVTL